MIYTYHCDNPRCLVLDFQKSNYTTRCSNCDSIVHLVSRTIEGTVAPVQSGSPFRFVVDSADANRMKEGQSLSITILEG